MKIIQNSKDRKDFYLPKYKLAIECQGEQHFISKEFFDKKYSLKERQELDNIKYNKCKEHNINVLYYAEKKYGDNIITDTNILLENIK